MLRISRGRHSAANMKSIAARSGTVPIIVPSAYTLPPSCSVRSKAVPPVIAAESSKNGSDLHMPARLNSNSDRIRKHGILIIGFRSVGQ